MWLSMGVFWSGKHMIGNGKALLQRAGQGLFEDMRSDEE
jgi:hypothetical protein